MSERERERERKRERERDCANNTFFLSRGYCGDDNHRQTTAHNLIADDHSDRTDFLHGQHARRLPRRKPDNICNYLLGFSPA